MSMVIRRRREFVDDYSDDYPDDGQAKARFFFSISFSAKKTLKDFEMIVNCSFLLLLSLEIYLQLFSLVSAGYNLDTI